MFCLRCRDHGGICDQLWPHDDAGIKKHIFNFNMIITFNYHHHHCNYLHHLITKLVFYVNAQVRKSDGSCTASATNPTSGECSSLICPDVSILVYYYICVFVFVPSDLPWCQYCLAYLYPLNFITMNTSRLKSHHPYHRCQLSDRRHSFSWSPLSPQLLSRGQYTIEK